LDTRNGRTNFVDFSFVYIVTDTNGEDENSVVLGVLQDGGELSSLSVVLSISHKQHHLLGSSSSVGNELLVTSVNTTTNTSVSTQLLNGSDSVEDRCLIGVNGDYVTRGRGKHSNTNSGTKRSEGVGVHNVGDKVLHIREGRGGDRTRLIEYEHEINEFTALLSGTTLSGNSVHLICVDSSDVLKNVLSSVAQISAARVTAAINVDDGDNTTALGETRAGS